MKWIRPRAWAYLWPIVLIAGVLLATTLTQKERPLLASDNGQGNLPAAGDINPDPNIFETFLVAMEAQVDLGNGVTATPDLQWNRPRPADSGEGRRQDHRAFHQQPAEPASIHWHGIELTNRSDGTGITQDPVPTGETFTYDSSSPGRGSSSITRTSRRRIPSSRATTARSSWRIPNEQKLIAKKVIPNRGNTKTFIIGDTTVCKGEGLNDAVTFPADPNLPWVGTEELRRTPRFPDGRRPLPSHADGAVRDPTRRAWAIVTPAVALPAGAIPNIQPGVQTHGTCNRAGVCPRREKGNCSLMNGRVPAARGGSPGAPGALAARRADHQREGRRGHPAAAGQRHDDTLLAPQTDLSIATLRGRPSDSQVPLFRIGGQGGLLDSVRVEGGTQGTLNTQYEPGRDPPAGGRSRRRRLRRPEGRAGRQSSRCGRWTIRASDGWPVPSRSAPHGTRGAL